jgi:hypothetical protein
MNVKHMDRGRSRYAKSSMRDSAIRIEIAAGKRTAAKTIREISNEAKIQKDDVPAALIRRMRLTENAVRRMIHAHTLNQTGWRREQIREILNLLRFVE